MVFSSFSFGAVAFTVPKKREMTAATEFPTLDLNSSTNQSSTYSATTKSSCFVNDSLSFRSIKLTAYTVIFLISLVLNSSTVFLVWKKESMRNTINYYIVNMAVCDLIITLVYIPREMTKLVTGPFWMVQGTFGAVLCKVVPSLHVIAILASILTLLAICVDRFIAIVFPMRHVFARRRIRLTVILVWVISTAARLPYTYALTLKGTVCTVEYENGAFGSGAKQIYTLSMLVTFCVVPLAVETVLYSIAIVHLKFKASPGNETTACCADKNKRRAGRKLLQLAFAITVAFLVCWTPYFLAQIAYSKVPCDMRFWRFILAHSNSAINPLLCAVFNPLFRQGYKQILCFQCITRRKNINGEALRKISHDRQRLFKESKV